ncbi:MAG TPA: hypothetical protein VGE31_01080 [Candidatus Paceibacterota bacterium]
MLSPFKHCLAQRYRTGRVSSTASERVYTYRMESIQQQLDEQAIKLAAIEGSLKKIERYMAWAFWLTIALFVLPLLGLIFVVPMAINSYLSSMSGLL